MHMDPDGPGEGPSHPGLAPASVSKGTSMIPRLCKFLPKVNSERQSLLSAPPHFHAPSETQVSVLERISRRPSALLPSISHPEPQNSFHSGSGCLHTGVEQCCLNTTERLPDSTLVLTSQESFPQRGGTTILEIGSCSPLNWGWRNGGTG